MRTGNIMIGAVKKDEEIKVNFVNYYASSDDKESKLYNKKHNTLVGYEKGDRVYLAVAKIDHKNKDVTLPNQPRGYKALKGLDIAIKKKYFK